MCLSKKRFFCNYVKNNMLTGTIYTVDIRRCGMSSKETTLRPSQVTTCKSEPRTYLLQPISF